MQQRSRQVARTRERIVAAAAGLFAERGARATSMTEVARSADVSTATVTNHFPTPDLLIEAVVAHLMARLDVPGEEIFAGRRSTAARLVALTTAMFAFFDRTSHWYYILGDELTEVPAIAKADAAFRRSVRRLHQRALAGTDDEMLARSAAGLIHPATLSALKEAGLSVDEAAAVVAGCLAHQARRKR
jgi:AcrR family transcriptional regulator